MTCKLIFTRGHSKRREEKEFDDHGAMVAFFKRPDVNFLMSVWSDDMKKGIRKRKGAK